MAQRNTQSRTPTREGVVPITSASVQTLQYDDVVHQPPDNGHLPLRNLNRSYGQEKHGGQRQHRLESQHTSYPKRLGTVARGHGQQYADTAVPQMWEVGDDDNAHAFPATTPAYQLPSPPLSERSRTMSTRASAPMITNGGRVIAQSTAQCQHCGASINSGENGQPLHSCSQCHTKRKRMARARESHIAIARRAQGGPVSPPISNDAHLSMQFARTIETIGSHHSWITLGPSRVGSNRAFDGAAQALYLGAMFRAQKDSGRDSLFARNAALLSYTRAARQLQKTLDSASDRLSDEVLATVTLFYTFEVLVPSPQIERTNFHHLSAIKTILLNRSNTGPPSELTRALVYTVIGWIFYAIAALGFDGPSPFENEYFLNLEPYSLDLPPAGLTKLKKLTLQLYIKLPRFITQVRRLRGRSETEVSKVVEVATDLLHLEDRNAENMTVRLLNIQQTRDETGIRDVVPYSYDFHNLHWQGIVNYWQCRLMVLRLCLTTNYLAVDLFDLQWLARQQEALLVREQDRIMESVLMCWQYASDLGFTGRAQMIASLNEIWGALAARETTSRGVSAAKLRTFILEQRRRLGLGSMGERGAKDMNEAMMTFGGFPNLAHVRQPVTLDSIQSLEGEIGTPSSVVWEVNDEEVQSEDVELDWFGFGKNDLKSSHDG